MSTDRQRSRGVAPDHEAPAPGPAERAAAPKSISGNVAAIASDLDTIQRSAGNQAAVDFMARAQTKLQVGSVDDPAEAAADRMADHAVEFLRSPGPVVRRVAAPDAGSGVGGPVAPDVERRIAGARGSGSPLDPAVRRKMEGALGADLGAVRTHTGPDATSLNEGLQARAFTVGNDVFFRGSAPDASSESGQRLLAHELTHTIQQGGSVRRSDVIRRMPTANQVKGVLGDPKGGFQLGKGTGLSKLVPHKNSEMYRAVLTALSDFDHLLQQKVVKTKAGVSGQLAQVLTAYDTIITKCQAYETQQTDHSKAQYLLGLKMQAQNEKGDAIKGFTQWGDKVDALDDWQKNRSIMQIVAQNQMLGGETKMNEAEYTRNVGGGTNTLNVFNRAGKDYFFKPNQATLDTFKDDEDEGNTMAAVGNDPAKLRAFQAKQNRTYQSQDAGIDINDSRTANREVATYRLDALLGANVIARTQFALRQAGVNAAPQLGSVQEGATGRTAGDFAHQKPTTGAADKAAVGAGAYLAKDPNMARQLNKLHLLDLLALQLDRNLSNFYLQLDNSGNVVKVTGIDNDVSFGTKDTSKKTFVQALPGLCQYVDKDMADKILALDPALVTAAFSDLLSPGEIAALLSRLQKLKTHLNQIKAANQFLTPTQWAQAVMQLNAQSQTYQAKLQEMAEDNQRGY